MGGSKTLTRVKLFLKASSEQEMVDLQLKNNHLNNMMYNYDPPQKVDGGYIVWFFADITKYRRVK
jgi:hypothetical protein